MIGNHGTFLFLVRVGRPCLTIFGGKSQGYYEYGKVLALGVYFNRLPLFYFQIVGVHLTKSSFCLFAALDHPNLEDKH